MTSKLSVLQLAVLFSIWLTTAFSHDTFMLVCNLRSNSIARVSLVTSETDDLPIQNIKKPVAIDYDEKTEMIYWADDDLKQIRATPAEGADANNVILSMSNDSKPKGIALDIQNQKVFYTDDGRKVIGVVDMDGSNHEELVTSGVDHPHAIVFDQIDSKLYFTNVGESSYIAVVNTDGSRLKQIHVIELFVPTGLALDKTSNMLFWCDGKSEKIETGSVSGKDRHVLMSNSSQSFLDIVLFDDILYFTVQNQQGVWSMPKAGGKMGIISSGKVATFGGLRVYSTTPKCSHKTPCPECGHCITNSSCEPRHGLCLAGCNSGYTGHSCNCQSGSGMKSCRYVPIPSPSPRPSPSPSPRPRPRPRPRPVAGGGIRSAFRQHLQSQLALFFISYVCVQTALID